MILPMLVSLVMPAQALVVPIRLEVPLHPAAVVSRMFFPMTESGIPQTLPFPILFPGPDVTPLGVRLPQPVIVPVPALPAKESPRLVSMEELKVAPVAAHGALPAAPGTISIRPGTQWRLLRRVFDGASGNVSIPEHDLERELGLR